MQCLSFLNKKVTREKNFENTSKCEKLRDFYDVLTYARNWSVLQ